MVDNDNKVSHQFYNYKFLTYASVGYWYKLHARDVSLRLFFNGYYFFIEQTRSKRLPVSNLAIVSIVVREILFLHVPIQHASNMPATCQQHASNIYFREGWLLVPCMMHRV